MWFMVARKQEMRAVPGRKGKGLDVDSKAVLPRPIQQQAEMCFTNPLGFSQGDHYDTIKLNLPKVAA